MKKRIERLPEAECQSLEEAVRNARTGAGRRVGRSAAASRCGRANGSDCREGPPMVGAGQHGSGPLRPRRRETQTQRDVKGGDGSREADLSGAQATMLRHSSAVRSQVRGGPEQVCETC